ncbi:ATP-binding protein [Methylorubrum rhodesianum]|uniref:ATP-binding protein n=1 Tax=Methylorubrum TaxID=2282523 RepID=UPI0018E3514B|nr:ATP-binding protein [Methylorubrum sp. DB1722]MBI1691039.1 hypothetical protein [Methylorubrum sp. DB1722]
MSDFEEVADPTAVVRALMEADDRRIIAVMERVKRVYVETARDEDAAEHFRDLMRGMCTRRDHESPHDRQNRLEGNIMVVLGASGAGKSTLLRNCFVDSGLCPGYGIQGSGCPVISVEAPSPCGSKELAAAVLEVTGWSLTRNADGPEAWRQVRRRLRALGVLILNINEMQHVPQSANSKIQVEVRNALKGLMVDQVHPVGLVISGMPETQAFLCPENQEERRSEHPDVQVQRRGSWMFVDPLVMPDDNDMVAAMVEELAKVAGLKVEADLGKLLVPRLMHAGRCLLGITVTEIHDAIQRAIKLPRGTLRSSTAPKGSPALTLAHFADAYRFRTGSLPRWNPYLADDYRHIDTSKVLVRREPEPPKPAGSKVNPPAGGRS